MLVLEPAALIKGKICGLCAVRVCFLAKKYDKLAEYSALKKKTIVHYKATGQRHTDDEDKEHRRIKTAHLAEMAKEQLEKNSPRPAEPKPQEEPKEEVKPEVKAEPKVDLESAAEEAKKRDQKKRKA
jgi:hypothetical protein